MQLHTGTSEKWWTMGSLNMAAAIEAIAPIWQLDGNSHHVNYVSEVLNTASLSFVFLSNGKKHCLSMYHCYVFLLFRLESVCQQKRLYIYKE